MQGYISKPKKEQDGIGNKMKYHFHITITFETVHELNILCKTVDFEVFHCNDKLPFSLMPSHMYKSTSHPVSSLDQLGNQIIIYSSQWCQKCNDINCCYSAAKQYACSFDLYGFHYTNQLEHTYQVMYCIYIPGRYVVSNTCSYMILCM